MGVQLIVNTDGYEHAPGVIWVPFLLQIDFGQAVPTLPFLEGFPRDLVQGMIATNKALVRARRLSHPYQFIGIFFGRVALTLDHLLSLLGKLAGGVNELMRHPGYDDPALAASSYRCQRETELNLLNHSAVLAHVADEDISPVSFAAPRR